jgi:hypothetical protein
MCVAEMTPWDIKRSMDGAFAAADRFGFELREEPGRYSYPYGPIYLFAKEDNTVFAKNMVLQQFDSWSEVNMFFNGYERAEMANAMTKAKK